MARCLIIGCGCRGRSLALELRAAGHAVRGTTRDPARRDELEAAGVQVAIGDPDRVATVVHALEHVSVVCVLLGSATGSAQSLRALHGPRLEMLLQRMLDTTVHGIVYEAAGSVDPTVLRAGAQLVRETCQESRIPHRLLDADPADPAAWALAATAAVAGLIAA